MNQAGDDIWVIVHLYDKGVMLSNILNNHFVNLAQKYKQVKFVRGVAKVPFQFRSCSKVIFRLSYSRQKTVFEVFEVLKSPIVNLKVNI